MTKTKINPLDRQKINEMYNNKVEEYSKLNTEELKLFWEESKKSKKTRIGGTNRMAFLDVLSKKLQEEAIEKASKEIKENDIKE